MQLKAVARMAKKENRTISELIREALRQYQHKQETPLNYHLISALRAVQEEARRAGLNVLPKREIKAEIAAYRAEQRQNKTKQP